MGMRRRSDQSRKMRDCSSTGAVAGGKLFSINSAQAAARSFQAAMDCTWVRSCSRLRCASHPETSANTSSTATTVR